MKTNLEELATQWRAAKAAEKEANQHRLDIEREMLNHFQPVIEGTETIGAVKVAFKVTRKVDTDALRNNWDALTENAKKCFRWSADVAIKELRAAQDMDKAAYKTVAQFITEAPAKPTITVVDLEG